MSEEEIKKQYANGIVNADEVIKSLIDKFKIDKTSVDIQQLQLIAEYLIYKADKLQKENEELHKQVDIEFVEENYIEKSKVISKNKIRTKIKELTGEIHRTKKGRIILKDIKRLAKIEVLKEVLGE